MKISISLEKFTFSIESDGPVDLRAIPIVGGLLSGTGNLPVSPSLPLAPPPSIVELPPAQPPPPPPAAPPRITGAPPVPQQRRKPLKPQPSEGQAPRNAHLFTSPQHPGKTFTLKQVAQVTGVSPTTAYDRIKKKKPIGESTFARNQEGIIPDYADLRGHTRGEADGDPMPVNGGRISANDRPAPKDLQRQL